MLFTSEHLCAKLLSLTEINKLKIIIFVLYYLTVSVYTKTKEPKQRLLTIHPRHFFTMALTVSLPELIMETCSIVLTFKSMDKILFKFKLNLFYSNYTWQHLFFNIS